jgi:hypothetical protein
MSFGSVDVFLKIQTFHNATTEAINRTKVSFAIRSVEGVRPDSAASTDEGTEGQLVAARAA